jgi:hypothetical protein
MEFLNRRFRRGTQILEMGFGEFAGDFPFFASGAEEVVVSGICVGKSVAVRSVHQS